MITNPNVKPELLKNLRLLISGGAPLGHTDEIRFVEKFRKDNLLIGQGKLLIFYCLSIFLLIFYQILGYGLTETSPIISFPPTIGNDLSKYGGNVGKLVPNTFMKIAAIDGEDVGGNF